MSGLEAGSPTQSSYNDSSRSAVEQRKARKREQDRLCQRRKREKDRENLRKLEARLDGLQNSDEPKVVLDLLLQREQDQAKIERQGQRLRQIEALLQAGIQDLSGDASTSPGADKSDLQEDVGDTDMGVDSSEESEMKTHIAINHVGAGMRMLPGVLEAAPQAEQLFDNTLMPAQMIVPNPLFETRTDLFLPGPNPIGSVPIGPVPIGPVPIPASLFPAIGPAEVNSAWTFQTQQQQPDTSLLLEGQSKTWLSSLNQVRCIDARTSLSETAIDQHIIINVVLRGWDHAASQFELDPIWLCLRQLDEAVLAFWNWRNVERLVSLLLIRMQMKGQVMGGEAYSQIEPKFLRPRPSQVNIAHPPNADYFPWPGVRERFVFDSAKYSHDNFLQIFGQSTRFLWPFKFSDMFRQNGKTRLLQFSPELTKRFSTLNCWTIDSAFLHAYPEFMGDMPTFNSVPPQINDQPYSGQSYLGDDVQDVSTQEQGYVGVGRQLHPHQQQVAYGKWNYDRRGFIEGSVMG